MPRCHIYHKPTGTLLARDLYPHRQPWLLDRHDCHEVVPLGAFFVEGRLLLGDEGLVPLRRDPETEGRAIQFLLAADEETRAAWVQVDACLAYFIGVQEDEWELEPVSDEDGVCWVAWIQHLGQRQLLRAAYGRDDAEAKKRLIPAAQKRLEQEAGAGSQPGAILSARIECDRLENFARSMGFEPEAEDAEVTWLFRKYGTHR